MVKPGYAHCCLVDVLWFCLDGSAMFLSFWYSAVIRVSVFSTSISSIARFIKVMASLSTLLAISLSCVNRWGVEDCMSSMLLQYEYYCPISSISQLFTHSLIQSPTRDRSFMHSLIHPLTHSITNSRSLIHALTYSPTHSFIHSPTHPLTHLPNHAQMLCDELEALKPRPPIS